MFYTGGMEHMGELLVDPHPDALDAVSPEVVEEWFALWESEHDAVEPDPFGDVPFPVRASVSALDVVDVAIQDAAAAQFEANRAMAAHVAALARVIDVARCNPRVYLTEAGLAERDALELAERAAAVDAALQLRLTPAQVRTRAYEGAVLAESLPEVWALFRAGVTGYPQASAAVEFLTGLSDPAAIARYDTELAAKAATLTPGAFRRRARAVKQRLLAEPAELRHARAVADRRVILEPAEDGMAWIHAYLSAGDAVRIKARLDATAKRVAKKQAKKTGERQPRDQIRADLLAGWLAGDGTPTAARIRPLLLVPLLDLLGAGGRPSVLQGYGPIDRVTAAQLFSDAPAFRRVGTDPFTGEVLDLDRTRYRPTKAQRESLAVRFGTCGRENCDRLAVESDVDHLKEWVRDHGLTNLDNLIPLCPPDHRLKSLTKIRYHRDPDGSVTVSTPTGYTGRNTPPPPLPDLPPF
jgi:hypothetical protein